MLSIGAADEVQGPRLVRNPLQGSCNHHGRACRSPKSASGSSGKSHSNQITPLSSHLQMDDEHSMMMLYRATQGVVRELHCGLTLARVVPLPPGIVEHATLIAQKVEQHTLQRKKVSETVLREKRRKLILNLKEHLVQAYNGVLEGEVLTAWLHELQKEFVNRMTALETEAANASCESEGEGQDEQGSMRDGGEPGEQERPSTDASQPSVKTIDSHGTSLESESPIQAISEASTVRAVSENEQW